MASLTVRNIPEDAKRRFRQVAAAHGRSMEEHMRQLILASAEEKGAGPVWVKENGPAFRHRNAPPAREENWVDELVRIANGAGEGMFDPEPQPLREFDL